MVEFRLSGGYATGVLEVWEHSTDIANNTSVVHAKLSIRSSAWGWATSVNIRLNIEGADVWNQTRGINHSGAMTEVVAEGERTITHNVNGTKSVSVSAWLSDPAGVFSGSGSDTLTLANIPRNSSGSFNKSSYKIGETITINFNRASSNFTHDGYIQFPDIGGWVQQGVKSFTGAGMSYSWTPTADEKATLYSEIPSSTSATMWADCITRYGGADIGHFAVGPATMSVNEDECRPLFSSFTYKDTNATVTKITGNDQVLVQGESKLRVTIPSANKATARCSASMKSYEALISGLNTSNTYSDSADVNLDFSSSAFVPGTQTLTCLACDSRNLTTKLTKDVQVIAYARPIIHASAERENNFENETTLTVKGEYSPLTIEGVAKNTIKSVKYRYKAKSVTDWGNWAEMTGVNATDAGKYTTTAKILTLDNTKEFEIEVQVTDKLGTTTEKLAVSVGVSIFRIGTDGFVYNNEQPIMTSHVGQVIISTTLDTAEKVQAIYGGKWERWGAGRFILGVDPDESSSAFSKTTTPNTKGGCVGGFDTHSHPLGYLSRIDDNGPDVGLPFYKGYLADDFNTTGTAWSMGIEDREEYFKTGELNDGMLPQFITAYFWLRVA